MAILKAGTYVFKEVPTVASPSVQTDRLNFKSYMLTANNTYSSNLTDWHYINSGFKSLDTNNTEIVCISNSLGDVTEFHNKTYEAERGWYQFYYADGPIEDRFTATDTTKLRTIIVESDQTVDDAFYSWFIANIEIPRVSIDLTTLSGYESLPAGTYQLAVRAKAANYQDSDLSSTVSFTKLAAPVVTAADTSVTWDAITNADNYDVYVDGELYENTTGGAAFRNVPMERDTSRNLTLISGMDKTKIYSLDVSNYISWSGTKWVTNNAASYEVSLFGEDYVYIYANSFGNTFDRWINGTCLEGTSLATKEDFDKFGIPQNNLAWYECLVEGTQITLADRTTKPVEDITYDDDLLVWNFYEGKFDSAKPCWIMKPQTATKYNLCRFSNGSEVGFVGPGEDIGYHRIYNGEAKLFTHTGVPETPIGTHTFAEDGSFPELMSQEVVQKDVWFYNIGTTKHINLFANGILTSARISNKYAIEDMKYVGDRLINEEDEQKYIEKALMKC